MNRLRLLVIVGILITGFFVFELAHFTKKYSINNPAAAVVSKSQQVNKNISVTGNIEVTIADDLRGRKAWNEYWLKDSVGNYFKLAADNLDTLNLVAGESVTVRGVLNSKTISTSLDNLNINAPQNVNRTSPTLPVGGIKKYKVAVVLFNFTDNPTQTYSPTFLKQIVYGNTPGVSVNNFIQDISSKKVSIVGSSDVSGDVYGWYTIPVTQSDCVNQFRTWMYLANQAAAQNGFVQNNYDAVFYNFPTGSVNCLWTGIAPGVDRYQLGNSSQPLWLMLNGTWTPTFIHEFGHLLGLNHANSLSCFGAIPGPVSISSNCVSNEYGDPFDTMGGTDGTYFNNRNRDYIGYIPQINQTNITTSGVYRLKSGNVPSSNQVASAEPYSLTIPLGLNIPDHTESVSYYIESRTTLGWDSQLSNNAQKGITIRLALNDLDKPWELFSSRSYLIDAHPLTNTFIDAPLQLGESFYDQDRHLKITFISQTTTDKSVKVEFLNGPINCTLQKPTITAAPLNITTSPGVDTMINYTIVNNDSGTNCPLRTFKSSTTHVGIQMLNILPVFDKAQISIPILSTKTGYISLHIPAKQVSSTLDSYQFKLDDIFSYKDLYLRLFVDANGPCMPNTPSLSFDQGVFQVGPGQSIFDSFFLTNNNSLDCSNAQFNFNIQNPYLNNGWMVSQGINNSNLASFQRSQIVYSIDVPSLAAPGHYSFPVSVTDSTNGVNYGTLFTITLTVQ